MGHRSNAGVGRRPRARIRSGLVLTMHFDSIDDTTGLIQYAKNARSSLPRWALARPSEAVCAAVGSAGNLQNFHVLIAVLVLQQRDWYDPFIAYVYGYDTEQTDRPFEKVY